MLSRTHVLAVALAIGLPVFANGQGTSVSVFAGNGLRPDNSGPYPDGTPHADGKTIALGNPFGIEVIGDNVWITTVDDQCVWKCDSDGKNLRRVAGDGTKGASGDDGPATAAKFNWPHEVRIDTQGNMYIADTRNHLIRLVDIKSGKSMPLAGNGTAGFSGEGDKGTNVQFDQPHSVVLDGEGGLLVADTKNHRIRRIDLETRVVETICGTGERKLPKHGGIAKSQPVFGPRSLAVDRDSIWVVLREGNSVWRIDRKDKKLYLIAGTGKKGYSGDGGPPLMATFNGPKGIAIDHRGGVLVVDTENHAVRRIDLDASRITTVLGGKEADATMPLKRPHGIAPIKNGFLVGDSEFNRVLRCSLEQE